MRTFVPAGYFAIRTPTLPWDDIERWSGGLLAARALADGADVEDAVRQDAAVLRARLREIVERPLVRDAIYLASPGFHSRIDRWLAGGDVEHAPDIDAVLVRYVMRMAGRATPFGLFAGIGIGRFGTRTHLIVPEIAAQSRHTRLDMEYLLSLAEGFGSDGSLRTELSYAPASEIYQLDGRIRYYEARRSGTLRTYHLVEVEATPQLAAALEFAGAEGGATIDDIARHLTVRFSEVEHTEAVAYVTGLVEAHLLRRRLSLQVTGTDPALGLALELQSTREGRPAASVIEGALGKLAAIDARGPGVEPYCYEEILADLACLPARTGSAPAFQVDLYKPHRDLELGEAIVEDVGRTIEFLAGFRRIRSPAMERFARAFARRYQEREVPLLEVLDEDAGIPFDGQTGLGPGTPLLVGLALAHEARPAIGWSSRDEFLLRRLSEALSAGSSELRLTDEDVRRLTPERTVAMPTGLGVIASIAATSEDALAQRDYRIFVDRVVGRSAGVLLARFCAGDAALLGQVRATLKWEEQGDGEAIHAEIAHLPQGRAGNVIFRPLLRGYEIAMFGASGACAERQIPLDDLLVSVQDSQVWLRSKRHGVRVVPHLTCAHAFQKDGLGIYRFLAAIEESAPTDFAFSWGPLASAPFLPRVTLGRTVLSLACWNIPGELFRTIHAAPGAARFAALQSLRTRLRLPRWARLADGDNTLPIDFENVLSAESFLCLARHRALVTVCEMFPSPDEFVASGKDGRFHHELIIPFVRSMGGSARTLRGRVASPAVARPCRARRPGQEWLYVKLYCGTSAVDRILTEIVTPFLHELRQEALIDRWHFLRYADPDWHLRLRFRGAPTRIFGDVAPELLARTNRLRQLVSRVLIDTYDPEEERYGGEQAIDLAERIFEADSDAAVSVIAEHGGDAEARWQIALFGMDAFLDDFVLTDGPKQQIILSCYEKQMAWYGQTALRRQIGARYRVHRAELETLLEAPPARYAPGLAAILDRSLKIRSLIPDLLELERSGRLTHPITSILGSYLHMWANRIFDRAANPQELVLYDFLRRLYRTRVARANLRKKGNEI